MFQISTFAEQKNVIFHVELSCKNKQFAKICFEDNFSANSKISYQETQNFDR